MASKDKFHVLAVDDNPIDRMCIEKLLKTSFYQVTVVDSGIQALEFLGLMEDEQKNSNLPSSSDTLHKNEVHLIMTDYSMPGMTGYDLLKKIKESPFLKHIPVAIMSSEDEQSKITSCLEEGAVEYIKKPVRSSDLEKLKQHLLKGEEEQHDTDAQLK